MACYHLAKLLNHPTGSQNFTTWCNDCISISMLLIVLLAFLMKCSRFLQSDLGTSTSCFTPSFFISFAHRQKCLCACSGVSIVGPSGACAPLTFSLLNVILNKRVAYLYCSCYTHMNNLVVVAIFRAACLLLVV